MFYYFIPKCEVKGSVILEDKKNEITEASGWYDHEFGKSRDEKEDDAVKDIAWNWLAVQLDNGCELSVANLFNTKRNYRGCGHWAIYIDEKGERHTFDEFYFKPLNSWTSMRTFNDYPTKWSLEIPDLDLKLKLDTPHEQQEFITIISKPAFWEGRMNVKGTLAGKPITGPAYIERSGFEHRETMDDFLKAVGKATQNSIKKILPLNPNKERAAELITRKENTHYLNGFDIPQYTKSVIKPIRDIIDRGGKSWRSYAALACCDIVGGNSQPVADGLALPEMLHVGSLIVDDVQDKSEKRRGGPSCHKVYGEALAINAGCSCYFIGQIAVMHQNQLTDAQKVKIYGQYFEALRAAHAGQAGLERPSLYDASRSRIGKWKTAGKESTCHSQAENSRTCRIYGAGWRNAWRRYRRTNCCPGRILRNTRSGLPNRG